MWSLTLLKLRYLSGCQHYWFNRVKFSRVRGTSTPVRGIPGLLCLSHDTMSDVHVAYSQLMLIDLQLCH